MTTMTPSTRKTSHEALTGMQAAAASLVGTAAVTLRADGQPALPLTAVGAFYRSLVTTADGQRFIMAVAAEAARAALERNRPASAQRDGMAAMAFPLPDYEEHTAEPESNPAATPGGQGTARDGAALVVFTTSGVRAAMRPVLAADMGLPNGALPPDEEPLDAEHVTATLRLIDHMLLFAAGRTGAGANEAQMRRDRTFHNAARRLMAATDEDAVLREIAEVLALLLHMDHCVPYLPGAEGWEAREGCTYWGEPVRDAPSLQLSAEQEQDLLAGTIVHNSGPERPRTRRVLVPLLYKSPDQTVLEGVIAMEALQATKPPTPDEQQMALLLAVQAAMALRTIRAALLKSTLAGKLQEILQSHLDPNILPGLSVATRYEPAARDAEVGGDFYDVFPLPGNRMAVVVGDVAGKGMDAAIHTSLARYTLRAYALLSKDPAEVLRLTNEALARIPEFEDFLTVALVILEPGAKHLHYASAGHCPCFLYRRGADAIGALESTGTLLGMMPGLTWESTTHKWAPGDTLLMYTDGISEAHAPGSVDLFETTRIRDVFASNRRAAPESVIDAIYTAALSYSDGIMHDDCALLLVTQPV